MLVKLIKDYRVKGVYSHANPGREYTLRIQNYVRPILGGPTILESYGDGGAMRELVEDGNGGLQEVRAFPAGQYTLAQAPVYFGKGEEVLYLSNGSFGKQIRLHDWERMHSSCLLDTLLEDNRAKTMPVFIGYSNGNVATFVSNHVSTLMKTNSGDKVEFETQEFRLILVVYEDLQVGAIHFDTRETFFTDILPMGNDRLYKFNHGYMGINPDDDNRYVSQLYYYNVSLDYNGADPKIRQRLLLRPGVETILTIDFDGYEPESLIGMGIVGGRHLVLYSLTKRMGNKQFFYLVEISEDEGDLSVTDSLLFSF